MAEVICSVLSGKNHTVCSSMNRDTSSYIVIAFEICKLCNCHIRHYTSIGVAFFYFTANISGLKDEFKLN